MKDLGSYNKHKGRVCAEEEKDVSIVEGRERKSARIYTRTTEERIYLTFKVASNSASVLCRKKGWEEVDGTGL